MRVQLDIAAEWDMFITYIGALKPRRAARSEAITSTGPTEIVF